MQSCAHNTRVTPQLLRNWKKNGGGVGWNYKKQKHYENPCNLFFVSLFFLFYASPKFTAPWSNSVLFFTKLLVLGLKLDSEVMWFERLTVMRCQMMRAGQSDLGVRLGSETDFLLCLVLFSVDATMFVWTDTCLSALIKIKYDNKKTSFI